MLYDGDTFEHAGNLFRVTFPRDDDHGAPWDEEDGHGPVTGWESRGKRPGEMVLSEDSRGRAKRFYDFAEAVRIARRDGWGHLPYRLQIRPDVADRPPYTACGGWAHAGPYSAYHPHNFNNAIAAVYQMHRDSFPSARAYAAAAALADFDRLRRWCADDWCYVGVIVTLVDDDEDEMPEFSASVWGIESDASDYLEETARELADEVLHDIARAAA
jgi:hypothetical protein